MAGILAVIIIGYWCETKKYPIKKALTTIITGKENHAS